MQDYEAIVEQVVKEVLKKLGEERKVDSETACAVCVLCGKCVEKVPDAVEKIKDAGASRISSSPGVTGVSKELAPFIDHTLLKPEATESDIERLCNEARQFGFASVCVNPCYVKLAARLLEGSRVKVCSVVGFPLGANRKEIKAYEARRAVLDLSLIHI